jgi:hypothetical protein
MCQSDEQLRHNLTDFATLNTIQYEAKLASIDSHQHNQSNYKKKVIQKTDFELKLKKKRTRTKIRYLDSLPSKFSTLHSAPNHPKPIHQLQNYPIKGEK